MTKYEWERQLKKGISGLPKEEQQRVLDYYNELFADKIDAGLREQYIISEFGNPYDVANKILVDYYNGDKDNPDVDAYIYADSDDIDEAFDDAADVKTAEPPKRKTWAERKEERREEQKARREEPRGAVDSDERVDNEANDDKNKSKGAKSASGLIVLICVLIYCVLGACFNLWHPAWLIFLIIPCVISLIEAINRRNWRIFAYPLFATSVFLALGFFAHNWHPSWIIFITIPIYYVLGDFITKNADKNTSGKKSEPRDENKDRAQEPKINERSDAPVKSKKSKGSSNVAAIIAKVLLTICLICVAVAVWWCVIGLFIGGVGMIIGGIGCIAGGVVSTATNWLLVGAGIAVLGLGLICAFGMAALFKPCFNMCKSFVKTIKNSFSEKEVA